MKFPFSVRPYIFLYLITFLILFHKDRQVDIATALWNTVRIATTRSTTDLQPYSCCTGKQNTYPRHWFYMSQWGELGSTGLLSSSLWVSPPLSFPPSLWVDLPATTLTYKPYGINRPSNICLTNGAYIVRRLTTGNYDLVVAEGTSPRAITSTGVEHGMYLCCDDAIPLGCIYSCLRCVR